MNLVYALFFLPSLCNKQTKWFKFLLDSIIKQ